MTWRIVAASELGTSHATTGKGCEDSCKTQIDRLATGQPLLSIFVSDGAGSAQNGGDGAELAIQAASQFLAKKLEQGEFSLDDGFATELVMAIRETIYAKANLSGLTVRDFACTFLSVLSSPTETLALQIGDGGIVLDVGDGLEIAITPMTGEYANMTNFITDENALEVLTTKIYFNLATRIAAFSDGLQRLALNMATNTPHEPFFIPFFNSMLKATSEQELQLQPLLVKFLGSKPVNERTDDDKTLALAIWRA